MDIDFPDQFKQHIDTFGGITEVSNYRRVYNIQ